MVSIPVRPRKGEPKDKFMSRCMSELSKSPTQRPQDQKVAICMSYWRKGPFSETEIEDIIDWFAEEIGYCKECNQSVEEAEKIKGYEPPEGGDLPEHGKVILANAYASCRKNYPNYSKERCSKIAWGAVHNAGYVKKDDKWVKSK